uniref:39S ribosomal protein L30, mitochondrial n=1 Tax=Trichobilharzia regenti TaxID=157069 RepID=A0AA85KGH0_TRIRE|nr:unnamed protein product [Trichobilharzia regenti]
MNPQWTRLLANFKIHPRLYHVSVQRGNKSYTKESKPVPGSRDHKNPLGWAKRLFQLKEMTPVDPSTTTTSEPPLLHMVCRLKPLKGVMHYQKAILEKYGLGKDTKNHTWVIVKNTPSVNRELYEIKHLVRIQPVIFENGLPSEADLLTCKLLPDGRFFRHRGLAVDATLTTDSSKCNETSLSVCDGSIANVPKVFPNVDDVGDYRYLTRRYLRQWHNKKWENFEFFKSFSLHTISIN